LLSESLQIETRFTGKRFACQTRFTSNVEKSFCVKRVGIRVARFFLIQTYQIGKNTYTNGPQTTPNGHILYQMAEKYTNIFHSKALQNIPTQIGIFGFKINHQATLVGIFGRGSSIFSGVVSESNKGCLA
jgi:hypothetical protein